MRTTIIPLIILIATRTLMVSTQICSHCHCNRTSSTVTCMGHHILIRAVTLPNWVHNLYMNNMLLHRMPTFTPNKHLKVLSITRCSLAHIDPYTLHSLPALEHLNLSVNALVRLPECLLCMAVKLRVLDLSNNSIANLSTISAILAKNHQLDRLSVANNPLRLGITNPLPLVRRMNLANANIEQLAANWILFRPTNNCTASDCRSMSFDSQFWSSVNELDISGTSVVDVSLLLALHNIVTLRVSRSILPKTFPEWLRMTEALQRLDLKASKIELNGSYGAAESWQWCGKHLQWIDISEMGLKKLFLNTSECSSLRYVYAQHNFIDQITILNDSSLVTLALDQNELQTWLTVNCCRHLQTLTLSRNRIHAMMPGALHNYPELRLLDLSHNQLAHIENDVFPTVGLQWLRKLNVSDNLLHTLDRPILPSLQMLDISRNKLLPLPPELFSSFPNLKVLNLRGNRNLTLNLKPSCTKNYNNDTNSNVSNGHPEDCWLNALQQLTNLAELDLSECNLSLQPDLSSKAFSVLQRLDLSSNQLIDFSSTWLPSNLKFLNLSRNLVNHLHNLSSSSGEWPTALRMDVSYNPLVCDCSLTSLTAQISWSNLRDYKKYYCFVGHWRRSLWDYLDNMNAACTTSYGPSGPRLSVFMVIPAAGLLLALLLLLLTVPIIRRAKMRHSGSFKTTYRLLSGDECSITI